jgi:hypothetical protein
VVLLFVQMLPLMLPLPLQVQMLPLLLTLLPLLPLLTPLLLTPLLPLLTPLLAQRLVTHFSVRALAVETPQLHSFLSWLRQGLHPLPL